MSLYERLYDEAEKAKVRFVGFISDNGRYDYGIVYTNLFFGKPLVVCMQTGRSSLLSLEDAENLDYLQRIFHLRSMDEAREVSIFLKSCLPALGNQAEREY